ncbi:MAG: reverse transcriptase-like protein [Planctomycetales bacterium]|nr:reverse transcriptase-like protein [Planctomycetales bacterium]
MTYDARRFPTTAEQAYLRRAHSRRQRQTSAPQRLRVSQVLGNGNLYDWLRQIQLRDRAAGPEGVRVQDLTPGELRALAREIDRSVAEGTYRVGPMRTVRVPKSSGGLRTLQICNLADAAVATALLAAVTPLIEPQFLPLSYGFRRGRDRHDMLAGVVIDIMRHDTPFVVDVDIRAAFDHVRVDQALHALGTLLRAAPEYEVAADEIAQVETMIRRVALGGRDKAAIGLRQGCPLSPMLLNALLHEHVDLALAQSANSPESPATDWYRYADNFVAVTGSDVDAEQALDDVCARLSDVGLRPRADAAVHDIDAGEPIPILGEKIQRREKKVVYAAHEAMWDNLRGSLNDAWDRPNPNAAAREAVVGWAAQRGGRATRVSSARVKEILTENGFREVAVEGLLGQTGQRAQSRWQNALRKAKSPAGKPAADDDGGSAPSRDRLSPQAQPRPDAEDIVPRRRAHYYLGLRVQRAIEARFRASSPPPLEVYTDGAATSNPGPAGYAYVVIGTTEQDEPYDVAYAGLHRSTNNRAELWAVIAALRAIPDWRAVVIHSDSRYVVDNLRAGRVAEWQRRHWRTSRNRPVRNADLWQWVLSLLDGRDVQFAWVRGHAGHRHNDDADRLANRAIHEGPSGIDDGYERPRETREQGN